MLYRLGLYADSAEVYARLDDATADPAELAVNRAAALCGSGDAAKAAQARVRGLLRGRLGVCEKTSCRRTAAKRNSPPALIQALGGEEVGR